METIQYIPYPELSARWSEDPKNFFLQCPWLEIEVEVEAENLEKIRATTSDLNRGAANEEVNEFLSFFGSFPVSYQYRSIPETIQVTSPTAFETQFDTDSFSMSDLLFFLGASSELLRRIPSRWDWNLEAVLDFSRVAQTAFYDPLAVYTYLRRLRLKTEYEFAANLGIFPQLNDLRQKNEEHFFRMAQLIIRQTYHITKNCNSCLRPALEGFPQARKAIQGFIDEERGHEFFALKSLAALGISYPGRLNLLEETDLSMRLLSCAAASSPLSFCSVTGVFEGNSYSEKDALAEILQKSSRPDAAQGIQAHYMINKNHEHSRIGEQFVSHLGFVRRAQVVTALRFTETLVILGNMLSQQLSERIQRS